MPPSSQSSVALQQPEHFGKYTVLRHLASGGMADLFLARATGIVGFEKIVVIKRIRHDLVGNSDITDLFLHEARLAAMLEHPHIAQVYDVGISDESYFFAMEYVHGQDLRKIMRAATTKKRMVPLADAINIGIGMCAALHYAHEKRSYKGESVGIIHRDVSPSNVLVSYDGAVKVCDFGVAKATTRTQQTAHGVLKGKISYMSPEQVRCDPLDRRSDIFAIAVVLYELTTLRKLFNGPNDLEIMKQLTEGVLMPPSSVRGDYPPELERILLKALSRDREKRHATAQELQLELEALARDQKLVLSSVSLQALMGELFEQRVEAWQEAMNDGKNLAEHLLDRPPSNPSATPPYESVSVSMTRPQVGLSERRKMQAARPSWPWLAAALTTAALGSALIVSDGHATDPKIAAAVQLEAERIGAMLDGRARALHMRADGIATMPMLRAGIGTDAQTIKDLAANEFFFTPAKNEWLELFQLHDGKIDSLLRSPADAPPIKPLTGRDTRLEIAGDRIVITASAPIAALYHATATAGLVAIANRVDFSSVRRKLSEVVRSASLRGMGATLPLLPGPAGASAETAQPSLSVQVPLSEEMGQAELTLIAIAPAPDVGWRMVLRYFCWAATLALLVLFGGAERRRRKR